MRRVINVLAFAWALLALLATGRVLGGEARPTLALTDKTLVAWVAPANLTQRGGSALTLIDTGERFDAIVLGEIMPGKWMGGSDFFRRTPRDQSAYPVETADAKTFVQVAIAYKGNQVSLFRNGQPYASYAVAQPQAFGRDTSVLIGLRYLGHMGPIGPFAGVIEEARLYDVALDAQAIAALKPNQPSSPKPIGLWTFEDGTANDAAGTFPPGQLRGGARIADGKLHLNGRDAYMISEAEVADNQLMFYKPRHRETGRLWDTWLFLHRGTYYLYYLANAGGNWDNISMATSPDGVHWKELGPILRKADGVTWMGTGSTWRSPAFEKDGKFQLNFSEWRGPRQTIFFAESADLVHWTRLGNELEFAQDERWYQRTGRWDCIWTIPRPGGGLYSYWTATPKSRGRFGFGQTLDGVRWEALEPPETPGVGEGEVGAVEKLGDRYVMLFGTGGLMITLVADRPEGPFLPAKKNLRVLAGHTYFARFFPTPDGMLVNHHSIAHNGLVYMGTLKTAVLDAEGTLRLAWWPGNDHLKAEATKTRLAEPRATDGSPIALIPTPLDPIAGVIIEGTLTMPEAANAEPVGLYVEHAPGQGTAILVRPGGIAELGPMRADGTGFKAEKRVDREMSFGKAAPFRLLLKHSLLEFYLNDILIECYSLPGMATGRLRLLGGPTGRAVRITGAWQL